MALAVPLSRFTSQVGGGSAFFVRLLMMPIVTPKSWRDNSDEELQQVIDREPGHSANHLIWATFVAGAIAAIAAVILLFR